MGFSPIPSRNTGRTYSAILRTGARATLRTAVRLIKKVPASLDRVQRYMYDIKPGESGFILGMGGSGFIPAPKSPELEEARQILFKSRCTDPDRIINSALQAKLTPDQTRQLFREIYFICNGNESYAGSDIFAFDALPAMLEAKLTPEQITTLLKDLKPASIYIGYTYALSSLPMLLKAKLTPEHITKLFWAIAKIEGAAKEAISILPELIKAKVTIDQILVLFDNISKKCTVNVAGNGYIINSDLTAKSEKKILLALPVILETTKHSLTPEHFVDFMANILEFSGPYIYPDQAIDSILALLEAKLTSDQIIELLGKIKRNCGEFTYACLKSMPAALGKAKETLSADQINLLFGELSDKYGAEVVSAFKALPCVLEAGLTSAQIVNLFMKIKGTGESDTRHTLGALPAALRLKLSLDQIVRIFGKISATCKDPNDSAGNSKTYAFNAFEALFSHLIGMDDSSKESAVLKFLEMLDSLNKYNRDRALNLLAGKTKLYDQINPDDFLSHYSLYMDILIDYKRIGYPVLEGIFEAENSGLIPEALDEKEISCIKAFINDSHSFSPFVYKIYKVGGRSILEELREIALKVINDELGREDMYLIRDKYRQYDGMEFLYAMIQMAIPLSGTSFVSRQEGKELLERMLQAGDLREHVPQALRDRTEHISLGQAEHTLKKGEIIDLQAISPILNGLRSENKAELPELVSAIESYLKSNKSEEEKEKLRLVLYRYASRKDLLGEKIEQLINTDHHTLQLLEEIFRDKDCLASILGRAADIADRSLFVAGKESLADASALIRLLTIMWGGKGTMEEKVQRLAKMTAKYRAEDIRAKVLTSGKLGPELASALNEILEQENQAYLSAHKLADEILSAPLAAIRKEKAKYEMVNIEDGVTLSLRMVKGIPFGLWGLNAGVCIASDMGLWKDPNFKLIAIFDEHTKTAVGFIHVYEANINGRMVWTLPGIEPSAEFIGTVDPVEFFDKAMEKVIDLAKTAGVSGVYVPTASIIHSNRSDIQKVIKDNKYRTLNIPQVNWSRQPAYPFSEVFVVWEGD